MNSYKILHNQVFSKDDFSLVPIRYEDRLDILKWRNEQIYHLRQDKPLTEADQENYFNTIVSKLFEEERPNQILFSFLEKGKCIGYGGLVHINWIDKNAEISFIMNTELELNSFECLWLKYLDLLQQIAFKDVGLHKIYTYAFDVRPKLYDTLRQAGFSHEATLKQHCRFNGEYIDVLIHSKINILKLRRASLADLDATFAWASDDRIRQYSFSKNRITKENHTSWFTAKLQDENCHYFILEDLIGNSLGSIRIDITNQEGLISYLLDATYHGRGLGKVIMSLLEDYVIEKKMEIDTLVGYVMTENISSIKIFEKLGYKKVVENNILKFTKKIK